VRGCSYRAAPIDILRSCSYTLVMARSHTAQLEDVDHYYNRRESRWGYRLILKGRRHYGYYPDGSYIPIARAHDAMEVRLARALGLGSGALVLDAGAGEGRVALHLAREFGFRVRGLDINQASVKVAQALARREPSLDVAFTRGDFSASGLPGENFDGVFTMETLVHAPDFRATLREFLRVLVPGGRLVLLEYSINPATTQSQSQRRLWSAIARGSGMHSLMSFEHGRLKRAVEEAGFVDVVSEDITTFTLPMLRMFYWLGWLPYQFVKLFRAEERFPNTAAAGGVYRDVIKEQAWRYNVVTARRPK
jgi:sterol 24-C-methyltransferase